LSSVKGGLLEANRNLWFNTYTNKGDICLYCGSVMGKTRKNLLEGQGRRAGKPDVKTQSDV